MNTPVKIAIGTTLFAGALSWYGYSKKQTLSSIFPKLTIKPSDISNLDLSTAKIGFNMDLKIDNPTDDNFDINSYGLVNLSRVDVFYDGVFLATSPVNITGVEIPARMNIIVQDIPVMVPDPIQFVAQNITFVYNMITNFDFNKLSAKAVIDVFGNQIFLG